MIKRLPGKKALINFSALWDRLINVANETNDARLKAILQNHATKKEYICRKLGVVSEMDVQRIKKKSDKK